MQEVLRTVSAIHSARTVGGVAVSVVIAVPQHRGGRCTRYCSAALPPVTTPRRMIVACNVARYSES